MFYYFIARCEYLGGVFMKELVIKAKTDKSAALVILKSFEPLIKKCMKMYVRNFDYYDDALQDGYLTILKCVEKYDLSSEYPFPAYARIAVIHNMRSFAKKIKDEVSLDEPLCEEGGTILDTIKSDVNIESTEIQSEILRTLQYALGKLSKKQREIIYAYYFKNIPLKDIAKNKRCHYMAVVKLKERGINALRMEFELYYKI